MAYDEYDTKSPFAIVLRYAGTVWPLVLPYCLLNCMLLLFFQFAMVEWGIRISILPQGHALMSLLIAYLGVSKVNLAYERYMSCRIEIGRALAVIRELHQYCITLTEFDYTKEAIEWRYETKVTLEQLIHGLVTMIKNSKHAQQLASNVLGKQKGDPYEIIHYLRGHLYGSSQHLPQSDLQLLERCKMLDLLHEFSNHYRELVRLSSTPLPFALVQMGRTFIFTWVLSLPLVLSGKDFDTDFVSAIIFVILLTYGFLGLEMVAMKLSNPFGDETKNDLNVKGMAKATILGMTNDSSYLDKALAARSSAQQAAASAAAAATETLPAAVIVSSNMKEADKEQQESSSLHHKPLSNIIESMSSQDQQRSTAVMSSSVSGDIGFLQGNIQQQSQQQLSSVTSPSITTVTTPTKSIRPVSTKERAFLLSARILHAPSENLDDSKDELADDTDDEIKEVAKKKGGSAHGSRSRSLVPHNKLLIPSSVKSAPSTFSLNTTNIKSNSTIGQNTAKVIDTRHSSSSVGASSPSNNKPKASSPIMAHGGTTKHASSMPPPHIHVSSMLPHFRIKPDWHSSPTDKKKKATKSKQQEKQTSFGCGVISHGDAASCSLLPSIIPASAVGLMPKSSSSAIGGSSNFSVRTPDDESSLQLPSAEVDASNSTTPYAIVIDNNENKDSCHQPQANDEGRSTRHGNNNKKSINPSCRNQWYNDSTSMQFSSSSSTSSTTTPYRLSTTIDDTECKNHHVTTAKDPDHGVSSSADSRPFLDLV